MALALVWTKRAMQGYDKIVRYLEQHWTENEVRGFVQESEEFFTLLSQYPELLQKTDKHKNLHRGPLNKLTIIAYRVKPRKNQNRIGQHTWSETEAFEIVDHEVTKVAFGFGQCCSGQNIIQCEKPV